LGARISEEATIKTKPMDPRRDKNHLEELWQAGKALRTIWLHETLSETSARTTHAKEKSQQEP